jgi:tyrosyl-DNA phosphodiesterase-1
MKLINPKRERAGRGVMHIKLMLVSRHAFPGCLLLSSKKVQGIAATKQPDILIGTDLTRRELMKQLYYKTSLRVAVSTANFIQYDWSTIENAVYVDDFPKQPEPTEVLPSPAFLETLLSAHRSLGTPQAYYKTALLDYDYDSAEKRVRLVLSVPGTHTGSRALFENGGHLSMCKALNDLDLVTPFKGANLSLECQGSFIGSYTSEWMKSFNRSALGWYPTKNSAVKHEESARKKYAYYTTSGEWPDDVKIVYPTFKTVKQSLGGPGGGGTIFCPLDTWKKPTFPRQLFYDSRSQRAGLLQHVSFLLHGPIKMYAEFPWAFQTKMILGIVKPADPPPATPFSVKKDDKDASEPIKPFGWLYIGSHNLSVLLPRFIQLRELRRDLAWTAHPLHGDDTARRAEVSHFRITNWA